jgi:hypothetical protein
VILRLVTFTGPAVVVNVAILSTSNGTFCSVLSLCAATATDNAAAIPKASVHFFLAVIA